jgi:hypothetical protein
VTWDDLLTGGWRAGINERDFLRLSFAQVHRVFSGEKQRSEERAVLTREISWWLYAVNTKGIPQPKNIWWPIGDGGKTKAPTPEETEDVYRKYGKLNKKRRGRKKDECKGYGRQ